MNHGQLFGAAVMGRASAGFGAHRAQSPKGRYVALHDSEHAVP